MATFLPLLSPDSAFLGSYYTSVHASTLHLHLRFEGINFHLGNIWFLSQISPLNVWLQWAGPLTNEYLRPEHVNVDRFQLPHLSRPGHSYAGIYHVQSFQESHLCRFYHDSLGSDLHTFLCKIDKGVRLSAVQTCFLKTHYDYSYRTVDQNKCWGITPSRWIRVLQTCRGDGLEDRCRWWSSCLVFTHHLHFLPRKNCILADEMGLGKTIQSITFLYEIFNMGIRGPFLIIAPLSTITNWEREFRTWTHMNVIVYHGSQISRQMILQYEMFYRDQQVTRVTRQHYWVSAHISSCSSSYFASCWLSPLFHTLVFTLLFLEIRFYCHCHVRWWYRVWYTNLNAYFMFLEEFSCFSPLNFKVLKWGLWLVSDSVLKPRLFESAVFLWCHSSTGKHYPQRAEVSRADHHFWDDNGRLPRVEEAPLALRGDWWSPSVEKQELQTSGRTETHEPGQSVKFSWWCGHVFLSINANTFGWVNFKLWKGNHPHYLVVNLPVELRRAVHAYPVICPGAKQQAK